MKYVNEVCVLRRVMLKDRRQTRQIQYQSRNWNSPTGVKVSQLDPNCIRKQAIKPNPAKLITVEVKNYF